MNSKNEGKEPWEIVESTSYEAWLSLLDVTMLYRSMLIRIIKLYSPEEMSFLIGEEPSYIGEMEKLDRVNFRMNKLWKKQYIVHSEGAAILFPSHPTEGGTGYYQLVKTVYADKVLYHMNRRRKDNKMEPLFLLWDDNHAVEYFPEAMSEERESLRTTVQELIEQNYFQEERSPYQMFSKCQSIMYDHIKPINLYQVLSSFTRKKGNSKLIRKKSKYSGYVYVDVNSKQ